MHVEVRNFVFNTFTCLEVRVAKDDHELATMQRLDHPVDAVGSGQDEPVRDECATTKMHSARRVAQAGLPCPGAIRRIMAVNNTHPWNVISCILE
jgi:hypothetical protein